MAHPRVGVREIFGLSPLRQRLGEAWLTFRGDPSTPASRFDRTSLRILEPRLSLPLWLGRRPRGRLVPLYNLFSHAQPPPEEGWSVRVTTARDFRGKQATYDSHNGTDFATPPGTVVVAAAPGRVLRVSSEFNRGGLKVFIDHGRGLVTTSNHLARALVRPRQHVARGEPIALSGMSGIDGFLLFPFSSPHVHFNVWLDGSPVDPFARPGEEALWRTGNEPSPHVPGVSPGDDTLALTEWDEEAVTRAIAACRHEGARAEMQAFRDPDERAMAVLFQRNYYPTRFSERPALHRERHAREPWLDLPFSHEDYDGVAWPTKGG